MARPAYSEDERQRIEAEIRAAALSCFASVGYRAASMRAIAAELGWSATALYRYYENKEALLAAVRAEGFRELGSVLQDLREDDGGCFETIQAAMRAYLEFARARSDIYRLMYELDQGEVAEHPEVSASRKAAFGHAEGMAKDYLLEQGMTGNANQMAHLFWISAHGLAALVVANQLDLGQSYKALVEPVLQMALAGDRRATAD